MRTITQRAPSWRCICGVDRQVRTVVRKREIGTYLCHRSYSRERITCPSSTGDPLFRPDPDAAAAPDPRQLWSEMRFPPLPCDLGPRVALHFARRLRVGILTYAKKKVLLRVCLSMCFFSIYCFGSRTCDLFCLCFSPGAVLCRYSLCVERPLG